MEKDNLKMKKIFTKRIHIIEQVKVYSKGSKTV